MSFHRCLALITFGLCLAASSLEAQGTPTLSALALNPTRVTGGSQATGSVTLSAAAGTFGAGVILSSSNTAVVTVPPFISVPPGMTRRSGELPGPPREARPRSGELSSGPRDDPGSEEGFCVPVTP